MCWTMSLRFSLFKMRQQKWLKEKRLQDYKWEVYVELSKVSRCGTESFLWREKSTSTNTRKKERKETDTQVCVWSVSVPGVHPRSCVSFPFRALEPRPLSPGSARSRLLSLRLAWGMSSSRTVSTRMERGWDTLVRAQQVGCPLSRVPRPLGGPGFCRELRVST